MKRSSADLLFVAAVSVALAGGGCVPVKAYQRGKLAHPTMALDEPMGVAEAHVYGVHEGAQGGAGEIGRAHV